MDYNKKIKIITFVMTIIIIIVFIKMFVVHSVPTQVITPSIPAPVPQPPRPQPPVPVPQPPVPQPPVPQPPVPIISPSNPYPLFTPNITPTNICSTPDSNWYGPLQEISSNSSCTCNSNEEKLSKILNGTRYYKCQLNNQ